MSAYIEYNEFVNKLDETVYKKAKADLLKKISDNPHRYIGLFRPTSPEMKLIQNITQSHEISFGDFIEDIVTQYLGLFYENLEKRHRYKNKTLLFDQLFKYNNKIFMLEQKMRDDHDSTKKRGQFENFIKKLEYLHNTYPNTKIVAGMWFVDPSLTKNKNYYKEKMQENRSDNHELYLFYGDEFMAYLNKISIWDEIIDYLTKRKTKEEKKIELNFEENWSETKKELKEHVTKSIWIKLISNKSIVNEILPILFPTNKYIEILEELNIKY